MNDHNITLDELLSDPGMNRVVAPIVDFLGRLAPDRVPGSMIFLPNGQQAFISILYARAIVARGARS